jgi:hypothetical protein
MPQVQDLMYVFKLELQKCNFGIIALRRPSALPAPLDEEGRFGVVRLPPLRRKKVARMGRGEFVSF